MQHSQGSFVWVLDKLGSFTDLKTGTSCSGSNATRKGWSETPLWPQFWNMLEGSWHGKWATLQNHGDLSSRRAQLGFTKKKWLVWVGFTKNLSSGNNTRVRTNPESTAIVISYMIRMMWDSVTWSWDKTKIYGCIMLYNPEGYRWYNANMFYRYMIV